MTKEFKTLSKEQIDLINLPFPEEALTPIPGAEKLTAIKPVFVTERFNLVYGHGKWKLINEIVPINGNTFLEGNPTKSGNTMYIVSMKTIFTVPEYDIYLDCTASSSNTDFGNAAKGAISDNTNKIGSWLGIGAYIFKGEYTPPAPKPGLHPKHPQWDNIKAELKAQSTSIEEVKKEYIISPAVERLLTK